MEKIYELAIKELIDSRIKTGADLASFKRKLAKKYKISTLPNIELLKSYHRLIKKGRIPKNRNLEELLRIRKVRSLSGITVISVLSKPYPCPGKCLYCPGQRGIPKSYLKNEPAVMRAISNQFDPYQQVKARLEALKNAGHPTDKIELIIIGGTWSFLPKKYQTWFIKRCFQACNENSKAKTLKKVQKINERAKSRIVGITIETRPDFINEKEIKRLRKLGVTRVELGVQSTEDEVLKLNNRGHQLKDTILATRLLKDAGFKICYHLMPNLPGSNLKKDEKMFRELFSNPDFCPDYLKIYPCLVLKEAPLYKLWKERKYRPYSIKKLINLLKKIKKIIPYWVRIQRLIRDIPSPSIVAGCKVSNLRQILANLSKKEGWRCRCIRCREVKENYNPKEKLYLFKEDYPASGGKEIFLSLESKDRKRLYSLLRLRIPGKKFLPIFKVLKEAALIRELHTYGKVHPLGKQKLILPQHRGLGKKLIKLAEKIAKNEFGLNKIAVISGVGVRDYYRRLGYRLRETYLIKKI